MLRAIILSIGDELALGQTVDTNSAWLSRKLAGIGVDIVSHITIRDDRDSIASTIRHCAAAVDLLIVSGGLGPTEDDLTREGLADAMGVDLVKDEAALATLRTFFARLQREMSPRNEVQTFVPRGANAIPNANGTAPGLAATIGGCRIAVMPGVPKEMFAMFETSVLPDLSKLAGGAAIRSRTLHTFGMGESRVAELLATSGNLMDRNRNPSVGTTVSQGVVSLRINARAASAAQAERELEETVLACKAAVGSILYGEDDDTLAGVTSALLRASHLKVTTAESCTGGLVAKLLTDMPGSSRYFERGFVVYANEAKTSVLGVSPELLLSHGAVSEPVAIAMAEGARREAGADLSVAITGVAGPGGGTEHKPVGTVCIALASANAPTIARTFHMPGDRDMIRDRSAKMAVSFLRYHLLRLDLPF